MGQINCEIMEDELDKTMKIVDDDIDGIDANVIETMEDSGSNTDDDNAIVDGGSDILGNMMFQYPLVSGSSNNNFNFVSDALRRLGLSHHHHVFVDFNIDQAALLHLDPSVVEFMITNDMDRNKFLQWLAEYKVQQTQPSKAPKQQSSSHPDNGMEHPMEESQM